MYVTLNKSSYNHSTYYLNNITLRMHNAKYAIFYQYHRKMKVCLSVKVYFGYSILEVLYQENNTAIYGKIIYWNNAIEKEHTCNYFQTPFMDH